MDSVWIDCPLPGYIETQPSNKTCWKNVVSVGEGCVCVAPIHSPSVMGGSLRARVCAPWRARVSSSNACFPGKTPNQSHVHSARWDLAAPGTREPCSSSPMRSSAAFASAVCCGRVCVGLLCACREFLSHARIHGGGMGAHTHVGGGKRRGRCARPDPYNLDQGIRVLVCVVLQLHRSHVQSMMERGARARACVRARACPPPER